jgi:hypothetical protein
MRINRTYGIATRLAVEELEDNAVVAGEEPVVVAAPVEAGADSVEAELVEVNSDIVEVAQDEAIVDDAAQAVDELEETAVALEEIAANGGLDRNGARVLNMHLASINRRLGYDESYGTLSKESFGGTADKVASTKLAAESIAEKAKELWGKIVEMFRSAVQAIVNVWNRLFDGATKLKARAENLAKAAADTKGEAASQTFENQTLATNLAIGGTVDAKRAADAVAREAAELPALSKANVAFAETVLKALEQGGSVEAVVQAAGLNGGLASHFAKVADAASVGLADPGEGLELAKSAELPGNKAIIAIVAGTDAKPGALGKCGYKLGMFDASKKVADKTQLKVLPTAEVQAIAKTIVAAADHLLSYKSAQKEAENIAKKVIAAAEKKAREGAQAEAANADGKMNQVKEGAKAMLAGSDERAIAKGAMGSVISSVPPLAAFALNAGGYVLQYGEQSLKQYGKKAEEKKPEGAAAPAAA